MANQLSKAEFYNSLVGLREKTGQGMEMKLAVRVIPSFLIDELVAAGLLEYNYRPGGAVFGREQWISIVHGYSVERYYEGSRSAGMQELTFIRTWLKHETPVDLGKDYQFKRDSLLSQDEFNKDYTEWLLDNIEELNKIKNTPLLEEKPDSPSDEAIEYLKSLKCYKENKSTIDCHRFIDERFFTNKKLCHNYQQILELTKGEEKYKEEHDKHTKDYQQVKLEMIFDEQLKYFLRKNPDETLVQNIY